MSTQQSNVKALLSEVVSRGARKRIAQHLGIAESDLSRRFSVHDERKSGLGEGLREVSAIAVEDPQAFPKVKAYVEGCLEGLDPNKQLELPLHLLVCNAHKEAADVFHAFAMDKSDEDLAREAAEAVVAFQKIIAFNVNRKDNEISRPRRIQRLRKTG